MGAAKKGDRVRVHYSGFLDDGTLFETSKDGDVLEFTISDEEVLPGFEGAVLGMQAGESKKVVLACSEAYGERDDEFVVTIDRADLPEEIVPEVGMTLGLSTEDGQDDEQVQEAIVTSVEDDAITVDGNHPLAGEDLTFELNLVEIVKP